MRNNSIYLKSANDVTLFNILRNRSLHGLIILNIPLDHSHIATVLVKDINRKLTVGYYKKHLQINMKVNLEVSMIERTNSRLTIVSDAQKKIKLNILKK